MLKQEDLQEYLITPTHNFAEPANSVEQWNSVARNGNTDYTDKDVEQQLGLCIEELKEVRTAYEKDDVQELIAELADCFVVMSYLNYMLDPEYDRYCERYVDVTNTIVDVEFLIKCLDNVGVTKDPYNMASLLEIVVNVLALFQNGQEVLDAKIASNWSKFIMVDEFDGFEIDFDELSKEALRIETETLDEEGNKRYNDVTAIVNSLDGYDQQCVVFRSNGGTGKIVKPYCYKDYKEFLS